MNDLPDGSYVGTSSLRRAAQLIARYPKLKVESVRGNLNTRLKKLDESSNNGPPMQRYSALVLAAAGVIRMGWLSRIGQFLNPSSFYYAVGQGSIAIEIREGDILNRKLVESINHQNSALRCYAERAFMRELEGGCSVPIGTCSGLSSGFLSITGAVFDLDGIYPGPYPKLLSFLSTFQILSPLLTPLFPR